MVHGGIIEHGVSQTRVHQVDAEAVSMLRRCDPIILFD